MDREKQNPLAQIICALVGLGYQVRTFCLDAWNFGSPQSRSRIFISCAAPGLVPLPEPYHTHSHPKDISGASLGKTANGLSTSTRYSTPTPFNFVTSQDATKDLPFTDSRIPCIRFPDHRTSRNLSPLDRVRISCIRRYPGGSNFITSYREGYMPQAQINAFNWHQTIQSGKFSKSWQRIRRNARMPTLMTAQRPEDGYNGQCLHWEQHRLLTIREARRGQGFLDHDILIGSPADQWKIIGNSVARPVAFALGLSLRTAWSANSSQAKVWAGDVSLENGNARMDTTMGCRSPTNTEVVAESEPYSHWLQTQDLPRKLKHAPIGLKTFATALFRDVNASKSVRSIPLQDVNVQ